MVIIGIVILAFVISIILSELACWMDSNNHKTLAKFMEFLSATVLAIILVFGIVLGTLIGVEGDNQELFKKEQQEYIVITQYINSTKSDSILESSDMMNRIKDYNDLVIEKQNDMTRPLLKYWAKGVNWNELKLINLDNIE